MNECKAWEAVCSNGARLEIRVVTARAMEAYDAAFVMPDGTLSAHLSAQGSSPTLAAHRVVDKMMVVGHDVRDLVPFGKPSRADLITEIASIKSELAQIEARAAERDALLVASVRAFEAIESLLSLVRSKRQP